MQRSDSLFGDSNCNASVTCDHFSQVLLDRIHLDPTTKPDVSTRLLSKHDFRELTEKNNFLAEKTQKQFYVVKAK